MPAATAAHDLELSSALRLHVMRLARRLRAERADYSLTLTQLSALSTLERLGAMTPSALAENERVQPPSVTRVVAALEATGLVTREPHPTDRRQCVIGLTPAGKALVAENRRRRDAWLAKQLRALDEGERAALRAALPVLERLSIA
jgi:DNA-binding MarR family transcriptional regulator